MVWSGGQFVIRAYAGLWMPPCHARAGGWGCSARFAHDVYGPSVVVLAADIEAVVLQGTVGSVDVEMKDGYLSELGQKRLRGIVPGTGS